MREAHLSEALDALDELRFIARCTEHIFRLMAKMKQKDQLRKTWLYDPEFYVKFHMTFMHTIDATVSIHTHFLNFIQHFRKALYKIQITALILDIKVMST